MNDLLNEDIVDVVVAGDTELGSYGVVKRYRPDVIALGYDQSQLKEDIEYSAGNFDWEITIVVIEPHEPETGGRTGGTFGSEFSGSYGTWAHVAAGSQPGSVGRVPPALSVQPRA